MNRSRLAYAGLAVSASLLAACTGGNASDIDGTPCDGKCDSIDPDEHLGAFKLVAPDLGSWPLAESYQFKYRNKVVELGQAYIFTEGSGVLTIYRTSPDSSPNSLAAKIDIPSGTTIEYKLAALVFTWDKDDYAVDIGHRARLQVRRDSRTGAQVADVQDMARNDLTRDRAVLVPPSQVYLEFSPAPLASFAQSVVAAEGQTTVVDLTPATEKRGFVHFKPPVNVQIPTPTLDPCTALINRHYVAWDNIASGNVREPGLHPDHGTNALYAGLHDYLEATAETTFRMYPDSRDPYYYIVNNMNMQLNAESGQTLELQAEHVDINDVTIFPPDANGNTTAHAKITIENQSFMQFCSSTTNVSTYRVRTPFGLDVPPKAIKLTLDYETGAGPMNQVWQCRFDQPATPGVSRCTVTN